MFCFFFCYSYVCACKSWSMYQQTETFFFGWGCFRNQSFWVFSRKTLTKQDGEEVERCGAGRGSNCDFTNGYIGSKQMRGYHRLWKCPQSLFLTWPNICKPRAMIWGIRANLALRVCVIIFFFVPSLIIANKLFMTTTNLFIFCSFHILGNTLVFCSVYS